MRPDGIQPDMIRTSNFKTAGESPESISIARWPPKSYKGPEFPYLFPPAEIITSHKKRFIGDEEYERRYREQVLDRLDPQNIIGMLEGKTLLCWCPTGQFCHRAIVAQWIRENGGECEELTHQET